MKKTRSRYAAAPLVGASIAAALLASASSSAVFGDVRPLGNGEQIVYQTVQSGTNYHTGIAQITGNASTQLGDEVRLGAGTANRLITNVAVGTQTFRSSDTLEYQPAFLQLSIYANDGTFDNNPGSPDARPNTLLGRTRIPGPRYPAGGVGANDANVKDFVVNFPFDNVDVSAYTNITFALINLDENGNPDIGFGVNPPPNPNNWQQPAQRFGPFFSTAATTKNIPASGGPDYNNVADPNNPNAIFNTNPVGQSRTLPPPYTLSYSGQSYWVEYLGSWGASVDPRVPDATIYAKNPFHWDINGASAGAGGTAPSGSWNGVTANFNTDSTGGAAGVTTAVTTASDVVIFSAGGGATDPYTVTLTGTQSASSVKIEEGAVNFIGGTLDSGTFDVAGGASGTVGSAVTGGTSGSVTKKGIGTLTITSNNTYTGGTNVQAGKLIVNRLQENNAVNISAGATLQVADSSPTLPSTPSGNNAFVSRPSSLTIANDGGPLGMRVYTGTLDLGNNDLILDYSGASTAADIEDAVRSGYNGGNWQGTGITSSTAANALASGNYALAVADNNLLTNKFGDGTGGKPQFDGQNVDDTTVIVKFTHRVDLDLDGFVTANDAIIFATNYIQNGAGNWITGDVDYDGKHTQNDAIIFATFYNGTLPSLPEPGIALAAAASILPLSLPRRRRTRRA